MIYKLKDNSEHFKILNLGPDAFFEAYEDDPDVVMDIMKQPGTNISLSEVWQTPSAQLDNISRTHSATVPNLSLSVSFLILDHKSYAVLGERLAPFGEFLPVIVEGEERYLFNCLTFGKEDETSCSFKYVDGEKHELESLAFDQEDVDSKLIFKSRLQNGVQLFCGEAFKEICEEAGLQGLVFDEDLLSIF